MLPDGVGQIRQRIGIKLFAGLRGAALHLRNREEETAFQLGLTGKIIAEKCVKSLTKTLLFCHIPVLLSRGAAPRQAFFFKNSSASAR